jgi:uncharacterized membrane protein YgcG
MCAARAGLCAALLFCLLPRAADAAGPKRAGVPKFDGAQEAIIRKQVMQALKAHGYELAKSREMETAMQNTGALLESDDGFQKIAKELALTVIVTGEVGKKRAKITIHDGREGSLLGEASFPGPNPKKIAAEVGKTFWSKLGEDIARGHVPSGSKKPQKVVAEAPEDDENAPEGEAGNAPPPPAPEPRSRKQREQKEEAVATAEGGGEGEGEAPPPPKKKKKKKQQMKMEADVPEEEESGPTTIPPTFDVALAPVGINRALAYNQDRSSTFNPNDAGMRPYALPLGPAVALHAVWYPIGAFTDGVAQNIGVEAGLEQAFAIQSSIGTGDTTFPNGAKFGTTVHEFEGGARYRIPFGVSGHQVWFSLTGGEHAFVFNSTPTGDRSKLDIPDTIYRYLRPGVGARFELPANFAFAVSAGYRYVFNDAGPQFGVFFPHRTVYGFDADLYLGYRVLPNIEIRAGGSLRQYGYAMNSTQADVTAVMAGNTTLKIAGGAVDRYISGAIGIAFMYGGSERPEPPPEDEAPPPKKKKKHHRDSDEDEGGGGGGDDAGGGAGGGASGGGGGDADQ